MFNAHSGRPEPDWVEQAERKGWKPTPGWSISTDRDGFSYHDAVHTIPEVEEGHKLDTIYISGPGNRALVIAIELPDDPADPIRVRLTEDGYGQRINLMASLPELLAWEPASDGGHAVNLPVSRQDMEEVI